MHFMDQLADLLRDQKPEILVLLETKVNGTVADEISSHVKFDRMYRMDGDGRRGGIWIFWDPIYVKLDVVHATPQAVHVVIQVLPLPFTWLFTAVYASPTRALRNQFWQELSNISISPNTPWLVAGDFNEILSQEEKHGGRPFNPSKAIYLQNFIQQQQLFDLVFSGSKYTWSNKRDGRTDLIFERIDKAFANSSWLDLFPTSWVMHLPRVTSDHHPLLLSTQRNFRNTNERTFRFESMWLRHKEFLPMLKCHIDK